MTQDVQTDNTAAPSRPPGPIFRIFERVVLIGGALIGGWFVLWLIYFGNEMMRHPPNRLMFGSLTIILLIVPVTGTFACVKSLLSNRVLWPVIAAICAGLIGAGTMLVGVAVGLSYHPDPDSVKLAALTSVLIIGALSMAPFIPIAISRKKRRS